MDYYRKKNFILDKVYSSNKTPSEYISVVPDLTKLQRQEEEELRAEAMVKNDKMSPEDFLIWEWHVRDLKGEKVLVKVRRKPDERVPVFPGRNRPPSQGKFAQQRSDSTKRKAVVALEEEEGR